MIPNEVFTEELLQQAASELATAFNDALPPPNKCQHKFSDEFEEKMQSLIRGIGTKCYSIAIQESMIYKLVKWRFGFIPNLRF